MIKLLLIPIAVFLVLQTAVRADEIPSGYTMNEDGKIVRDEPRTRLMKASSCGEYITQRECARIRRKNAERRAQNERRIVREKVYVADRRRDDEDDLGGRRCSGRMISAKGSQRPTEAWARRTAIQAWAREVRYDLGETYLTWSNARRARVICNPSSIGGFQIRCEAKGEPCQIR